MGAEMTRWLSIGAMLLLPTASGFAQGIITTVAGTAWTFPATPLPAMNAPLGFTQGIAVDGKGNVLVADFGNNMVFRIAPDGTLTVVAGNGTLGFSGDGGPATSASLAYPRGLALDSAGNVYIAESLSSRIRKVSGGIITTVAGNGIFGYSGDGGPATSASLDSPEGVAVDTVGNLFIADYGNNAIREVSGGIIATIVGGGVEEPLGPLGDGGPARSAFLSAPVGLAVDSMGNLYIADTGNNRIRRVSAGIITTVAGEGMIGFSGDGGPATRAGLNGPQSVALDSGGNLYIVDTYNQRIRKVTAAGIITTVAGDGTEGFLGDGGPASKASLDDSLGIALDAAGSLYIADTDSYRVRKVTGGTGIITTIAGNGAFKFSGDGGLATNASLSIPYAVAKGAEGDLYIADTGNARVRKVSNGIIRTVAGDGVEVTSPARGAIGNPVALAVDLDGDLYIAANNTVLKLAGWNLSTVAGNGSPWFSGDGGLATSAGVDAAGLALDSYGNLYIADEINNRIRKVSGGIITTVAGDGMPGFSGDGGPATSAELNNPTGVAVDSTGSLYIADFFNDRIREVSAGLIRTVAGGATYGFSGDGGPATSADLNYADFTLVATFVPAGVTVDRMGNLYIVDTGNDRVREVLAVPPPLTVSPASLNFNATSGGAVPPTQSISVSSSLSGLSFAVTTSASWLSVTPSNGAAPGTVQVSVDPSQLSKHSVLSNCA